MVDNQTYWNIRNRELKHMQQTMRSDASYKGRLTRLYNLAQEDIEKEIARDIGSFADREGVSMAEARKRIKRTDVQKFQDRAKQYVDEKNFSDQANRELRRYNVTMRTNRLELLEAKIHLNTVALADEEAYLLENHLSKEYIKEYERQAGILEMSVPSNQTIQRNAKALIEAEVNGRTFSDNVWTNQRELQSRLEVGLRRNIQMGQNPRKTASDLYALVSKEFIGQHGNGGAKYAADRLAITESARIQIIVQEEAYKENGITQYMYIAEPSACDACGELDGKIFDVSDMQPGTNAPVMHPSCRCSTASYVDRSVLEN